MFVGSDSADIVDVLGYNGFDFVVIDMEHGPGNPASVLHQVRTAEARGMDVIARIPNIERTTVLRTLDIGVSGLKAPQVNDEESARELVRVAKYPPAGCRGFAATRAGGFGTTPISDYLHEANDEVMLIVQCETEEAVRNIDAIASIDEIDMIFIGPYDLSLSLGVPGELFHPKMLDAFERVITASNQYGKLTGTFVSSTEEVEKRIDQGFTYLTYGLDHYIFSQTCAKIANNVRSVIERSKATTPHLV